METYVFSSTFELGVLLVVPVHVRIEELRPIIAAHAHSNTSYEIHYAERGRGSVTIGDRIYPVKSDTLYITGPGVMHAQISDRNEPITEYCLYINCRQIPLVKPDFFTTFTETTFWIGQDEGRVFPLLKKLIEEKRHPQPGTAEMSEAILKQIIITLTRMYCQPKKETIHPNARQSLPYAGLMPVIEDAFFYRYQTLTLEELAALLHLSVRQTQRFLKSNFGKTFSQKLIEARIAAAAQLLMTTDLSVTEIGERTGFGSLEHFSAAFKKYTGLSPTQYKKGS
ncbi:MAG: AraC family transcriptional regulator [Blautia sp.]|nr:AraC family transcriptional regulator [Blautia sp.]